MCSSVKASATQLKHDSTRHDLTHYYHRPSTSSSSSLVNFQAIKKVSKWIPPTLTYTLLIPNPGSAPIIIIMVRSQMGQSHQ